MAGLIVPLVGSYAPARAAAALATYNTYADLPAATGSLRRVVVKNRGLFTDVPILGTDPAEAMWLPDSAVRDTDDSLFDVAWALNTNADKCLLRPGLTVPASFTVGGVGVGSVTTNNGRVRIVGYFTTDVASTSARLLGVSTLQAAVAGATTDALNNHGVFFGSYYGSSARMIGLRYRGTSSTPRTTLGYYGVDTGLGEVYSKVGEPSFVDIRLTNSTSMTALLDATTPGGTSACSRAEHQGVQRWFEGVAINHLGADSQMDLSLCGILALT